MTLYARDLIKIPQYHIHGLEIKNKQKAALSFITFKNY